MRIRRDNEWKVLSAVSDLEQMLNQYSLLLLMLISLCSGHTEPLSQIRRGPLAFSACAFCQPGMSTPFSPYQGLPCVSRSFVHLSIHLPNARPCAGYPAKAQLSCDIFSDPLHSFVPSTCASVAWLVVSRWFHCKH